MNGFPLKSFQASTCTTRRCCLTPEQREKVEACNTAEELVGLAMKAGYKLSDEELDSIAGGGWNNNNGRPCPYCGKHVDYDHGQHMPKYCPHCGGQIVFSRDDS